MNLNQIKPIAESWLKTPFKQNGSTKGHGVDCKNLVAKIYEEITNIKVVVPTTGHGQYIHNIEEEINKIIPCYRISAPAPGSIIVMGREGIYALGISIDGTNILVVDQTVGVCYKRTYRASMILYPQVYAINKPEQKINESFVPQTFHIRSRCKNCD
jgi:hypothetical protein